MDGGGLGPQLELKVERNPSHNVVTCVTMRRGGYFPAIKAFRLSLSYFFGELRPQPASAVLDLRLVTQHWQGFGNNLYFCQFRNLQEECIQEKEFIIRSRSLSVCWLSGAYYFKVAAAVLSRPYTTSQALWEFTRRIHSRQSLSCAPPGPPPHFRVPTPPPPAPLPTHGPALCSLRSWASRAAERISIPRGHSIARH